MWRTMPPISCTSKCRMFSTRLPASRTTANASTSRSSSDSPSATRFLNSCVLARSCSSLSACTSGSSAPISTTRGASRLSSRSFCVPMTLARSWPIIRCFGWRLAVGGSGCEDHRREHPTTNLQYPSVDGGVSSDCSRAGTGSARKPQIVGRLSVSRLLREKLQRIDQPAVGCDLVMQMVPGGAPRGADLSDDVASLDFGSWFDKELQQVPVPSLQAEPVIDHDEIAVRALISHLADRARRGGVDGLSPL